ncbi:outer mitochondrial membrane transport complex protein-domain-containing protein [Gamsiella multidivaricata]|uniref:outer mitochondrial membrane transport complex protein-domain-containing protein n=1 Tax=Gamsiella multidivaricata TaxID=101098 RepID=UPI00221F89C6|nr:outer mitochondrial membrane transport complex protein-domain-containing protein [Gamsiella multidivaricata]KAG0352424.1 metaxin 1 [Gamsiella multidivaricata]KAI7827700.1 outer mitochondrial membrane transport complex protein-domain-containing protein [Gamsiella multidivaricata]
MVAELYIYGSAFGLPSIDPQCLALISYLSIVSHQEYTIVECNDVGISPTGELPMFHDGRNWIAGANRIIAYLSRTGYNANEDLSAEELAKSVAYSSLVDESLTDAILFSWFADADNFLGATRKAYSNLFSIPSKYILPIQMRKAAVQRVQKYGGTVESGALTHADNTKIYDLARDCYRVLDRKLGENEFFFGVKPTSLDAKVFGYLALQLYPEIPNPRFQIILTTQFPRLVAYCDRCREEFFANLPDSTLPSEPSPFFTNPISAPKEWFRNMFLTPAATPSTSQHSTTEGDGKPKKTKEERDFDLKRIYAVTFGVVAMIAYVIVNGLVVVGNEDDEGEEGYYVTGQTGLEDDIHMPADDFDN